MGPCRWGGGAEPCKGMGPRGQDTSSRGWEVGRGGALRGLTVCRGLPTSRARGCGQGSAVPAGRGLRGSGGAEGLQLRAGSGAGEAPGPSWPPLAHPPGPGGMRCPAPRQRSGRARRTIRHPRGPASRCCPTSPLPLPPPPALTATPGVTASAPTTVWVGGRGLPAHCSVVSWLPCPVFQQPPRAGVGQDMVPQPQPPPAASTSGILGRVVIVPPLPVYSAAATGLNWEGSSPALQTSPQCPWSASPAAAAGTLPKGFGEVPALQGWQWGAQQTRGARAMAVAARQ